MRAAPRVRPLCRSAELAPRPAPRPLARPLAAAPRPALRLRAMSSAAPPSALRYPPVRRDETCRDNPRNTPDPYRWLEDPDSPETRAFVEAQNKLTFDYLQTHCSSRVKAKARMEELYNYGKFSCPFRRGNKYYYFHNTGLQNQSVLFVQDALDAEARVFLDPNALSPDGTTALAVYEWSESGRYFAYGVSHAGSDWVEIHVLDTHTGQRLSDLLKWVKFSGISWTHDERGFFYCRYPAPASASAAATATAAAATGAPKAGTETDKNEHHKVYYHVLGEAQERDALVFDEPSQAAWMYGAEVTDDGRYVVIEVAESTAPVNRVFIADLRAWPSPAARLPVQRLVDDFRAQFSYLANDGTLFYFRSNLAAPRYKVLAIDIAAPAEANWRTVLAEHPTDVLNTVAPVARHFLLTTRTHDVKDVLELRRLTDGSLVRSFADASLVGSIYPACRRRDDEFFFKYVSFLAPGTIYRYAFADERLSVFRQIEVKGFDAARFHTEQVFYASKDGTRIPMFLVHARHMQRDGSNPVLLYGYGGFNISLQPAFSIFQLVWIAHYGGVLAMPNIRGGGEYGEEWHKAGILDRKQNGFDDFMAAAEYLVREGVTRPERICIQGGSNGGLLVGACVTQRPELFGAGIAQVGVLDMLRFHKFTIGHAWCADYGNPDDERAADVLLKYSPLHNVRRDRPLPALLLTTGDHDDRVSPLHSYKFIAEAQHALGAHPEQRKPLLIRIETKAGHGAGTPTAKVIEEAADRYAFAAAATGAHWKD